MSELQPFVHQLRDAMVVAGIATQEQGDAFIDAAEREVEDQWAVAQARRDQRSREYEARPWWWRMFHDKLTYRLGG